MPPAQPLARLAQHLRDLTGSLQGQAASTTATSDVLRDLLPSLPADAELRAQLPPASVATVATDLTTLRAWGAGLSPPSLATLQTTLERLATSLEGAPTTPSPPPTAVPPPAPRILSSPHGDWRLLRELGQGGQGTAFLAQRDTPEVVRGVAKLLNHRHGRPPTAKAIERFRREVAIIDRLRHPCIVAILDRERPHDAADGAKDTSTAVAAPIAAAASGEPWVVLEHVPLGSLQDHLPVFRGDVFRVLRLGRDLATALLAAHQEGIIHRDVKPANVLLHSLDRAVLSDFGIAHDEGEDTLTSTDENVRARWFGPPEAEHGRVDHPQPSFDVYMLGKVLYVALSGGQRFPREDFTSPPHNLCTLLQRPELEAVNVLLRRMIVADPLHRLQSMADVIQAIDSAWLGLAESR